MPVQKRQIFREEAVQCYLQARDEKCLPEYMAPQGFTYLWALIALLLCGLAAAGLAWLSQLHA